MTKQAQTTEHPVRPADRKWSAEQVGEAVEALLVAEGWSIPGLGRIADFSPSTARNLAKGKCDGQSVTAGRLFQALGYQDVTSMPASKNDSQALDLTNAPNLSDLRVKYQTSNQRMRDSHLAASVAAPSQHLIPLILVLGGKRQCLAAGLPREVTHVAMPSAPHSNGHDRTVTFACPNPDTGGNITVGRMLFVNQQEIPGGSLEHQLQRGDLVLVLCPDGIRRARAWLGGTRVINLINKEISDTADVGYMIEGRILLHAPVEARVDVSPWGGLSKPVGFGDEHQSNERGMGTAAR